MLSQIWTGVEAIQLLLYGSSFKDLNGLGGGFPQGFKAVRGFFNVLPITKGCTLLCSENIHNTYFENC